MTIGDDSSTSCDAQRAAGLDDDAETTRPKRIPFEVSPGTPLPLGSSLAGDGVNFAVFSRHAQRLDLLLYDHEANETPAWTVALDAPCYRTGDVWHVRLGGAPGTLRYAWRAHGPDDPRKGHRFKPERPLLDPQAVALVDDRGDADTVMTSKPWRGPTCLVPRPDTFDWAGDCPLRLPWSETVIYETHVRGLSIDPSANSQHPGTFLGLIERIPYFQSLGVTAVELLPAQEFFENELSRRNPLTGERLRNYWGYSTSAFFAPKESYSTRAYPGCQVTEFKTMVRELHRAGIEVILDIVFNHTAEGDHTGPTLSYRGLDNRIYYLLEDDRRFYRNYSGCGNTLNCNHPVVRDHVLQCLRHWVIEMHVDGFRFDLASVLGRGADGGLLSNAPLLERIAEDPVLRGVKLIAEAWDAGGAYQVGSFAGQRWSEWNGRYRDDVRRFWCGEPNLYGVFASRLCGSADIYERSGKGPVHSINFVTCHDGFTLNDWASYSTKHNEANGEDNRDGTDANYSANHGVEGPSDDPAIEAVRIRQIKNLLATLFLSRGVPMLLGGDEFRRTQHGNNNAYCQDNALSWYDWRLLEVNREIFDFAVEMIALRKRYPVLRAQQFYADGELTWFDASGNPPGWDATMVGLGLAIHSTGDPDALCLLVNPTGSPLAFHLPATIANAKWGLLVDTGERVTKPVKTVVSGPVLLRDRSLQLLAATVTR